MLRNKEEVSAIFSEIKKRYDGVEVCINNAGLLRAASLVTGDSSVWQDMFNVSRPAN